MRIRTLIIHGPQGSGRAFIKTKLEEALKTEVIDEWTPDKPLPAGAVVMTQVHPTDMIGIFAFHDGTKVCQRPVDALPLDVVLKLFGEKV
jgi:hypothetical protein